MTIGRVLSRRRFRPVVRRHRTQRSPPLLRCVPRETRQRSSPARTILPATPWWNATFCRRDLTVPRDLLRRGTIASNDNWAITRQAQTELADLFRPENDAV